MFMVRPSSLAQLIVILIAPLLSVFSSSNLLRRYLCHDRATCMLHDTDIYVHFISCHFGLLFIISSPISSCRSTEIVFNYETIIRSCDCL
ncbi:uncharacterized protein EDB91DRAFT_1128445 [Suillus paluster]|uniref:uncharacterized protein n=1 Tax=Suillus paluster TaxID=48578 RepID=UPI001B86A5DE|nr:uncharacterized protein EDB91DRAFT_1128445 [Suillus paluster]KAG1742291.1 hypothetical protein EDB91DRAFT_1128445 [Suillus paluster]